MTDIVTRLSGTFLASSQPQVYGYDDLQMLQTRIPLVSSVKSLKTAAVKSLCTRLLFHGLYF